MRNLTLSLAVLALLFSSCRKESIEVINPDRHYCYTFASQFETVWTGIDQGYLFWDKDTVDWDARYRKMLPVFKALDGKNTVTDFELRQAWEQTFEGMLDHHMYISVKNLKTGNNVAVSPADKEVTSRPYYHPNYFYYQVDILSHRTDTLKYSEGTGFVPCYFALFEGSNGKKIAYLRFLSFNLNSLVYYGDYNAILPLRDFYGNRPAEGITNGWAGSDEVEGIIIDVRGNGGGQLADLRPFIGSLGSSRIDIGYSRTKDGLGRLDYSPWIPFFIDPPQSHLPADKKIVVLADVNSVSCSEVTTLMIKSLPNGTFIGERTYGAVGPLISGGHDILYSGVFGDIDKYGYYAYTSNLAVSGKNHEWIEGIGVEPDIECLLDVSALHQGHDNQLDRALQFLRTGK